MVIFFYNSKFKLNYTTEYCKIIYNTVKKTYNNSKKVDNVIYANGIKFLDNSSNKNIILMENDMDKLLKKVKENLLMILFILIYLFSIILLKYSGSHQDVLVEINGYQFDSSAFSGIITQLQLLIIIFLVIHYNKKGYYISLVLNCITFVSMIFAFINRINENVIVGIVVSIGIFFVITIIYNYMVEINKQKKQLRSLAYFDYVTGIANRNVIMNRLNRASLFLSKNKGKFALVFIDIDNFKGINDTVGHIAGDLLLKSLAEKIKEKINKKDLFGRTGGDEFAIIIQRDLSKEEILDYLNTIKKSISEEIHLKDKEFFMTASFGVSLFPTDSMNVSDILKYADMAMQYVKKNGKNAIEFYSNGIKDEIISKMKLEKGLKKAISRNEFFLVYQPQYYSKSNKIRGFEVLLRWNSKELGSISPTVFIPIAEETGSIIDIGQWVLNEAMIQFKNNILKYNNQYKLAINISPVQLTDTMFISKVEKALLQNDFSPSNLEFEITESVFISSAECAERVINYLKNIGITIALDDFGTGYSALSYLQYFSMNILKIDKAFIDKIIVAEPNKSLVESIISMAHKLDMEVIAEGVEEKRQIEYLLMHNCDFFQGFLFSKPLIIDETLKLLSDS